MRRRPLALAAAAAYVVVLAAVALWPSRVDADLDVVGSWPVRTLADLTPLSPWQAYDVVQVAANVALFAPLGWFAVVLLPRARWWQVAVAGIGVSAALELAQAWLRPERVASWVDVVANGLGAALGAGAAALVLRERPVRRT